MPCRLLLSLFLALLAGCYNDEGQKGPRLNEAIAAPVSQNEAVVPHPFHDRLLEIARSYESHGQLDNTARWAPLDCASYQPAKAVEPRVSASQDRLTHGRKLYLLFPKMVWPLGSYVREGEPNPVGQVVVKESWLPEEVQDGREARNPVTRVVRVDGRDVSFPFLPYARKDGRLYHAKEKGPLFIMYKLDPQTPDTDAGWVYGTVTADGKEVTSAGRVESCMRCHQKAPHDRLFGLPEK